MEPNNKKSFKESMNVLSDFIFDKKRYFLAGIIFIAIIYILTFCVGKKEENTTDTGSGVYESFQVDNDKELNSLIKNYYYCYSTGDTTGMSAYATPISDGEKSYIETMTDYIESFDNIKVYSKPGPEENSYFCSVYMEEHFVDIDAAAPGLDFFYVKTNDDGLYYIDNNYSAFNQANAETDMDEEVLDLIQTYYEQSDVISLSEQVQKEYDEALENNADLNKFVTTTLPELINDWKSSWQTQKKQQEAIAEAKAKKEAEAKAKAEKEAKEAKEKAAKEAEEAKTATTGYITEKVKFRESASTDANEISTLEAGTEVTVYSTSDGWSKVKVNDKTGYVKSEYISSTQVTTKTVSENVIMRASASTTASKVTTIPGGSTVSIQSYPDSTWAQVSFGGNTGYVKQEFLN